MANETQFGIFPHAIDQQPTGRGFVVRPVAREGVAEDHRNYGGLVPEAVYRSEKVAERRAEKFNQSR